MNPIYSLIELRQSHHYYHHFSILMVLLVYGYLVYLIAAALTITFLYLLSCKAISHTRIVALVLFPRWYKRLVCVELYQWLIELERIFILPLAPRWVRHSYLSKRLRTIPYTCGISGGLYRRGASSGVDRGTLTHRGRGQGLGHAALVCGALVAPLRLLFGSLEASVKF
jgi:hypothetical protein